MGKIVVSQNVSLDGVVEDPSGEDGFRHGGWFQQFIGEDFGAWANFELAEAQGAEALLLGRRSDEYFATRSSSQSGEWVDRLNSLPKYVVSSTLERGRDHSLRNRRHGSRSGGCPDRRGPSAAASTWLTVTPGWGGTAPNRARVELLH